MAGLAGPYDFLPMTAPDVIEVFGGDPNLRDSQPIHFVDGDEPPMLLVHGGRDRVVLPKNSRNLAAAVQRRGGVAELRIEPEAGHIGLLLALRSGSRQDLLQRLDTFFTRQIEQAKRSSP